MTTPALPSFCLTAAINFPYLYHLEDLFISQYVSPESVSNLDFDIIILQEELRHLALAAPLPKIIGLCGYSKFGHSHVSSFLIEELNLCMGLNTPTEQYSVKFMFKTLKTIAKHMYPLLNDDLLFGPLKGIVIPEYGLSPNEIFQHLYDFMRKNDPHYFVRSLLVSSYPDLTNVVINTKIKDIDVSEHTRRLVIPDVCTKETADWLKQSNGLLLQIERKDLGLNTKPESVPNGIVSDFKVSIEKSSAMDVFNAGRGLRILILESLIALCKDRKEYVVS